MGGGDRLLAVDDDDDDDAVDVLVGVGGALDEDVGADSVVGLVTGLLLADEPDNMAMNPRIFWR